MQIAVIIAMIVVVGTAIFQRTSNPVQDVNDTDISDPSPTATFTPTITTTPSPTAIPTTISTPTKSVTVQPPTPTNISQSNHSWVYPGSKKINDTTYTSTESAEAITQWYESKIQAEKMQINNYIKTSANSTIKNVLSAASSTKKVTVQINSTADSSTREIIITTEGY